MNSLLPERHGIFTIYPAPDLPGKVPGSEVPGFSIIIDTDHRFFELDPEGGWYIANVVGKTNHVLFRVPAWIYALYPAPKPTKETYPLVTDSVPTPVKKSMNNAHRAFDQPYAENDGRKWKYYLLDFSSVVEDGTLSSSVLDAEAAGDNEALDYDLIEVPLVTDERGNILTNEILFSFKVGIISSASRVTDRTPVGKTKLERKKEEAERRKQRKAAMKTEGSF